VLLGAGAVQFGQAMVDRGVGRSFLTRGRSRCRDEGRRGAVGVVWRGEDGAPFIGVGRRWWGRETVDQAAARGALSRHRLLEGEATEQR
jgi:hypothetical protein